MEHRLIRGGEQYLPFARSRVRALLALGLPYANQSFEIDGVSIKVRVEPGHEHIRIEGSPTIYMESGQLGWTFPGELNPTKYDPASWHFLDTPTSSKYLGKITASGKDIGKQAAGQVLTEGMESQAIGYPKASASYPKKAEKDAASKEKYQGTTIDRKITAGYFPASLFSGKLRLFMQAQYGAPANIDSTGLHLDLLGTSFILVYRGKTGISVQFGVYSHLSVGLYVAPDKSYWLIQIHNPTGALYIVKAYRVLLSSVGKKLRRKLDDPELSDDEKQQIEAYVLSDAVIETEKSEVIGSFAGRMENALAYGWKFSQDGSRASIVVNEGKGTGDSDNVWVSRTIHLLFDYETDEITGSVTSFKANASTTLNGEWTDSRSYSIFAPNDDPPTMGVLELKSLSIDFAGVKPEFPYSDVPVYGYYVDSVWTPIKLTRTPMVAPWPKLRWSSSGIRYTFDIPQDSNLNAFQYGYCAANEGCSFEHHSIEDGAYMIVSVGGDAIMGINEFGTHRYYTREVSGGGSTVSNTVNFTGPTTTPFTLGGVPDPDGFPYTGAETVLKMTTATITTKVQTYQGIHNLVWSLIIPTSDCEAVCVATWEYESDILATTTVTGTGVIGFSGTTTDLYGSPGMSYSFVPWTQADSIGSWYGVTASVSSSAPEPRPPAEECIYYFNTAVSHLKGTPRGSYYRLFNVPIDDPFYHPGMFSFTSYGKRYEMSEGLKSPASFDYQRRVVGWI